MNIDFDALWPQIAEFFGVYLVIALVIAVLEIVAWWKIFSKAGEKGWKSIIPFYNGYIQYKIVWDTKFFWIALLLPIVMTLLNVICGAVGGLLVWVSSLVTVVGSVALAVISIMLLYRLSQAFGHGVGFTLGLLFLQPIFILILGLGGDQYQGPYAAASNT